MTKNFH